MGKVTESRESIEITSSFELQEFLVPGTNVNDESMKVWSDLIGQVNPGSIVMGWYTVDNGKSNLSDEVEFNEEMRGYVQEMTDPIYLKVDIKATSDKAKIPVKVQMLQLKEGKYSMKDLNYTILANEQEKIVSEYLNESIILEKNESVGKHFCKSETESLLKLKEKIDGLKDGLIKMKNTKKYDFKIINEINKLLNLLPVNQNDDLRMKLDEINNESDLISLLHNQLNNSINMINVMTNCNECNRKLEEYAPKQDRHEDFGHISGYNGYGGGMGGMGGIDYDRMDRTRDSRSSHHRGSGGGMGGMFSGLTSGFLGGKNRKGK